MFGKQVARLGDKVTCPIRGHGSCTIVEGDPNWSIDGIPVALEGHKTSCGASLISSLPNVTRTFEGMGAASMGAGRAAAVASGAAAPRAATSAPRAASNGNADNKWIKFRLNEAGSCEGLSCIVHFDDGSQMSGEFDADNQVAFFGVSGDHVERVEFVPGDSEPGGSITEMLLGKLGV